jgi:hypothetical protein
MKAHLTLAFSLLLICAGTGTALAKTPDGMPPSLETVCDAETGAAYGLCTAYCEAMDCESAAPHASATACSQVRSKFQNITGRDLPCELTCPCTSISGFNAVLAGASSCFDSDASLSVFDNGAGGAFSDAPDAPEVTNYSCGYIGSPSNIILPITKEEAAACTQIIRNAIASHGLTCQTPE